MENLRCLLICCTLLALPICAQQDPSQGEVVLSSKLYQPPVETRFAVDTKLVELGVVVRDRQGQVVSGLTKDDFEITDDGKKREISDFSVETAVPVARAAEASSARGNPPPPTTGAAAEGSTPIAPVRASERYIALLFDDFSMDHGQLTSAQNAALDFVKEGLRAGDHLAFFTMSAGMVVPFSADSAQLADAVGKIHFNQRKVGPIGCPSMTEHEAYLIANQLDAETYNVKIQELARCIHQPPNSEVAMDVLSKAKAYWQQIRLWSQTNLVTIGRVVKALAEMPGERTLLLASSGFLDGTLTQEVDDVVHDALRAGVVISAIDAKGLFTTAGKAEDGAGGYLDGRSLNNMQKMAFASKEATNDAPAALAINTGGLFFENRNDVDQGFRELGIRPKVRYLIGFTPEEAPNGKYHSLKVRLKKSGEHLVQSRLGYMAVKPAAAKPAVERPIDTLAAATTVVEDLPGDLSAHLIQTQSGERGLMTVFHVDIQQLKFTDQAGARQQRLSLIAILTDADGHFVAGKEGTVTLALKDQTFRDYSPAGMNFTLTLPAPAGSYRLRTVMAVGNGGKMRARTMSIDIP